MIKQILRRSVLTVLAATALLLGLAPAALAHARLEKSDPVSGSTVSQPLSAARLTFTEPVNPGTITLTGADGKQLPLAAPTSEGPLVTQPIPALANGAYTLSYRVTSGDGHAITGTIKFTQAGVVPPPVTTTVPPTTTEPTTTSAAPTTTTTPEPAAAVTDSGSSPLLWILIGAGVLIVVAAVVILLLRRRR